MAIFLEASFLAANELSASLDIPANFEVAVVHPPVLALSPCVVVIVADSAPPLATTSSELSSSITFKRRYPVRDMGQDGGT